MLQAKTMLGMMATAALFGSGHAAADPEWEIPKVGTTFTVKREAKATGYAEDTITKATNAGLTYWLPAEQWLCLDTLTSKEAEDKSRSYRYTLRSGDMWRVCNIYFSWSLCQIRINGWDSYLPQQPREKNKIICMCNAADARQKIYIADFSFHTQYRSVFEQVGVEVAVPAEEDQRGAPRQAPEKGQAVQDEAPEKGQAVQDEQAPKKGRRITQSGGKAHQRPRSMTQFGRDNEKAAIAMSKLLRKARRQRTPEKIEGIDLEKDSY